MFTSRLPVSTSVRRPTNPNDTRPSNIPTTVRKANLFTPQTKRPYSMGTSTAGKSFTSGTATEKKFQRSLKPAPDRDAQQRMFDNLTDFLKTNAPGFPCPEAKKFFSSVSTTESTRIFEFLISRILPDFKISRLEIDVPEALSTLDYPFIRSVTKSSLVSVTTRQAAAGLLHIFDWLVKFIDGEETYEDDEPLTGHMIALRNVMLYPVDKVSDENYKALLQLYRRDDADRLDKDLTFVQQEQERLERQLHELNNIKETNATITEDIKKCVEYESQMQRYLQTKIDEADEIQQQLRDIDLQREDDSRQIDQLKHQINSHKLDIGQANREHERLLKLEQTLQLFRDQRAQAEAELALSKTQKMLERAQEWRSETVKRIINSYDHTSTLPITLELPRDLETEDDIRSAIPCPRAGAMELDNFISGQTQDDLAEIHQLETVDARYQAEIFPKIQDDNDKLERMIETIGRDSAETLISNKARNESAERQASQKELEILERNRILREKRDLVQKSCDSDEQNCNHLLKSSRTRLQTHLDSLKQRTLILTKDAKQEAEDWTETQLAWERKKLVATKAYKLTNGYPMSA